MGKELEIKLSDIDIKQVQSKLLELGCQGGKTLVQKLYVFDVSSISALYSMVKLLGYKEQDAIVLNTSKVYEMYGKNIYDYKELKF